MYRRQLCLWSTFDGSNRPTKEDLDPILKSINYSRPVLFQDWQDHCGILSQKFHTGKIKDQWNIIVDICYAGNSVWKIFSYTCALITTFIRYYWRWTFFRELSCCKEAWTCCRQSHFWTCRWHIMCLTGVRRLYIFIISFPDSRIPRFPFPVLKIALFTPPR